MKPFELIKGKIYREKVDSQKGYEDWEYTGITKEAPNGMLYMLHNDLGYYHFDEKDLENFAEIKMLEPRKRTALDGKTWWCVFDTENMKWSTITFFGRYKTKKACQHDIDLYEANNIDRYF